MFEFKELLEAKKKVDSNALATARSHVNEIHFARTLNGGKHISKELKAKHDKAASLLSPEEVKHQQKRAEAMADAYTKHATKVHGYKGKIEEVHVTAASGGIKSATGLDIRSQDHPADVVVRWSGHSKKGHTTWHGISAKSSQQKGTDRISNRGISGISKLINHNIHDHHDKGQKEFAETHGIGHLSVKERKKAIRANPKILAAAEARGRQHSERTRDLYHIGMKKMDTHGVRSHLLDHHFRTGSETHAKLPYVIASGSGDGSDKRGYSAVIKEPDESTHRHLIHGATHFTYEKAGSTGLRVYAHGKGYEDGAHVITLQAKHNTQKMASPIKIVGTEGSLHGKKVRKGPAPDYTQVVAGIKKKPAKKGKK